MICSLCMSVPPVNTHYARLSCRSRKPSALTKRSCPTGRNLQAEMSPPHSLTSHYVWADSGWALRYNDTLQRHGQLGDPSSPLSWKPPNPRTSTPCSPPHTIPRSQLHHIQVTLSQQMDKPSLLLKSLGVALPTHESQKTLVNMIRQVTHQQLLTSLSTNPIQKAILLSQTAKNTGAHLQQPNSEAYDADDRCFQVSLARRLVLVHPAASHPTNISPTCPNVSAAKRTCACPIDPHQLHRMICKNGGGGGGGLTNNSPRWPDA